METSHDESAADPGSVAGAATLGVAPSSSDSRSIPLPAQPSALQAQATPASLELPSRTTTEDIGLSYRDAQTGNIVHRPLKKSDWEAYRDIINTEYITKNQTLNTVIQTLRKNHGFCATPKMYKTRLTQWGVHKNTTKKQRPSVESKGRTEPLNRSPLEAMPLHSLPQSAQKAVYGPTVPYFQETMTPRGAEAYAPRHKDGLPTRQTNPFGSRHPVPSDLSAGENNGLPVQKAGRTTTTTTITTVSALPFPVSSGDDAAGLTLYSTASDTHAERFQMEQMSCSPSMGHVHDVWSTSTALTDANFPLWTTTEIWHSITPFRPENDMVPCMTPPQMMGFDGCNRNYSPSPARLYVSQQGHQLTRDILYDCVERTCRAQSNFTILGDGWEDLNAFLMPAREIPRLMNESKFKLAGELMRQTAEQIEPLMRGRYEMGKQWGPGPGPSPVAMIGMLRIFRLFHWDLPEFFRAVMLQAYRLALVWVPSEHHPTRRILAHMIEISQKPEADRLAIAEIVSEAYSWLSTKVLELVSARESSYLTWLLLLMYPEGSDDFMAYQHGQSLQKVAALFSQKFGDGHPRTHDAMAVYDIFLFQQEKVMNLRRTRREQLAVTMVHQLGFQTFCSAGNAAMKAIKATKATRANKDLWASADVDASVSVDHQPGYRTTTAAEQTILDAVQECVKKRDFQSALGYYELLEQWHAFRQDSERGAQIVIWRRQLEMNCGWPSEECGTSVLG